MKHSKEAHELIIQGSPIIICWNLLKYKRACKYGGKIPNGNRFNYAFYSDSYKLVEVVFPQVSWPPSWCGIIQPSKKCIHVKKEHKIGWTRPPNQCIKVNTNGSAIDNQGKIGT